MPVLTAAAIQKYKPHADRREIADSKSQGLFLIIQPSGTMSWAVRLRKPDGRTAKVTLGPVDTGDTRRATKTPPPSPSTTTINSDHCAALATMPKSRLRHKETSDEPVMGGALTLGQARQLAAEIDRKRARGVDVVEERKADKLRQRTAATDRAANSFGTCVREFFVDYRTKKRQTRPRRWRDDAAVLGLKYPPG